MHWRQILKFSNGVEHWFVKLHGMPELLTTMCYPVPDG